MVLSNILLIEVSKHMNDKSSAIIDSSEDGATFGLGNFIRELKQSGSNWSKTKSDWVNSDQTKYCQQAIFSKKIVRSTMDLHVLVNESTKI